MAVATVPTGELTAPTSPDLEGAVVNPIQPRRIVLAVGTVAGACAIAVPAALGLSGNPSFSQRIPIGVPSTAQQVSFDDRSHAFEPVVDSTLRPDDRRRHSEPGDDHSHRDHGHDDHRNDDHGNDHGDR
jgi:hypothetical protein